MEKRTKDKKTGGIIRFPGKIQNRHLDRSILLKETGSDNAIRRTILLIGIAVVGFIVWANFLEVAEVASTTGEIIHQGDLVEVQHLVGGKLKKRLVRNGSQVMAGQVLLWLDPLMSRLEREALQTKRNLLMARKIRITSLLSGQKPDFSGVPDANIAAAEQLILDNTITSHDLEKKIIENQIQQVNTEISIQRGEQTKLKKSIALIKEELGIRSKLRAKGLNPRITLLQLEKEHNNAVYSLKQIPGNIKKQEEKRLELQHSLANITAAYMENFSKELEEVEGEIASVDRQINISDSNIEELEIKAPVNGIVHDIRLKNTGQVARPGDVLLTLIPMDKPLVAKVKISSRDIGHIRIGQTAVMRFTTYDSRRYGVVRGTVASVSPSALIPEDKSEPYYEGIIRLNKNYVGKNWVDMTLFSGMTLTADIKTGSKYFIEYLLKPIYVATQTSFRER